METETTSNETIANELIESAPAPTIDKFENERKAKEQSKPRVQWWKNLTDVKGNEFDPEIHETDANGEPIKNARGKIKMKRGLGVRKAAKRKSTIGGLNKEKEAPTESVTQEISVGHTPEELKAAAKDTVNNLEILGLIVFQEDGLMQEAERTNFENAFYRLYEKRGIISMPPEMSVLIVCGSYTITRLNMEAKEPLKVDKKEDGKLTRMQKIKLRIGLWNEERKMKKENKKAKRVESPVRSKEEAQKQAEAEALN